MINFEKKLQDLTNQVTAREIDKTVCEWSIDFGISLTEEQLNLLVDRLCEVVGIDIKKAMT